MGRSNGVAGRVLTVDGMRTAAESQRAGAGPAVHLGPLADLIGFHLRRAQTASFQAFARRVGQTDLSPGTFALLTLIQHNPGISQTALSLVDGRDKSSLTPALNALARRGLVLRQRLPRNRRAYALSLTPAGGRVLAALSRHAEAHDRDLDRIVGQTRKAALVRLLRRIAADLARGKPAKQATATPQGSRRPQSGSGKESWHPRGS